VIRKHLILLSIILGLSSSFGLSQSLHTNSNKALTAYNEGKQAYDFLEFANAERLLKEAISVDIKFYEAYMVLGEMMAKLRRFAESATYYQKAVQIDSLFYKPVFFPLANSEMMSGNYSSALVHFNVYIGQKTGSEKNKNLALKSIKDCEFAIDAINNPVPFNPVNIGDSINTKDDEYWPSITADGQTMTLTRQGAAGISNNRSQEDFYISHLENNIWRKAYNAGRPLNTSQNEGAQTISSDGSYMYFAACDRPGGYGRCDIYFSSFDGNVWSEPVNIGAPVNTNFWESQPSISANGRMLFFTSNRPGGFGGMDLWFSTMNNEGKWRPPKNMGSIINSQGDEMSPFIHFDGRTLYYSSNGRIGMGGFDIYITRMKEDSSWSEPQNLGYPINTYNDELGLIIDAGGQKAYFSSKRDDLNGKDIFYFTLYEAARPDPVSYLRGKVYNKETGKLLKADYELINLHSGQVVAANTTDMAGSFLVCLPAGNNYGLTVNKEGFLFYSDNFMLEGLHTVSEPFIKRIQLSPIKVGEKILLSNVFYEFDSWELKSESVSELNRLYKLLSENKNIVVEIGGYTDSIGTVAYNMTLSERRAKSVVNYLLDKGIVADRLKYKGYGSTSPMGDNVTNVGRKLNRRTEVKVIQK
jgi:outer membrane protein OmpA-like peptidoglycan-associated protein